MSSEEVRVGHRRDRPARFPDPLAKPRVGARVSPGVILLRTAHACQVADIILSAFKIRNISGRYDGIREQHTPQWRVESSSSGKHNLRNFQTQAQKAQASADAPEEPAPRPVNGSLAVQWLGVWAVPIKKSVHTPGSILAQPLRYARSARRAGVDLCSRPSAGRPGPAILNLRAVRCI